MTEITVSAAGLAEHLGLAFEFLTALDRDDAVLTTEHATSSYGQPVLVREGRAFGPGDLPGVVLHFSVTSSDDAVTMLPAAQAGGWTVKPSAYCNWCADPLSSPETRRPGDEHPGCRQYRESQEQGASER